MAHLDLLVAFLNTDDGGDELASPEGLAAWAAEQGVLDPGAWVSPQDAAAWADSVDEPNAQLIVTTRSGCDRVFEL